MRRVRDVHQPLYARVGTQLGEDAGEGAVDVGKGPAHRLVVLAEQIDHHVAALHRLLDVVDRADRALVAVHHAQVAGELEVPHVDLVATMRHDDSAADLAKLIDHVLSEEAARPEDSRSDAADG